MRVQLLGGFGVEVDGQRVDAARWRPRKARTVVKLLALEPDQRLHREYLLDLLWPGLPPPAAANNLHQALHVARRALIGEGADGLLELRDQVVVLRADGPVEVDAARRDAVGDRARRGTNGAPGSRGRSPSGSATCCPSSAAPARRPDTGPCAPPWSGATTCSRWRSSACCTGSRSSRAAARWRPGNGSAPAIRCLGTRCSTCSVGLSTSRWSRWAVVVVGRWRRSGNWPSSGSTGPGRPAACETPTLA